MKSFLSGWFSLNWDFFVAAIVAAVELTGNV